MTRVLVISDSHGARDSLRWVLTHEQADALIYLGDGLADLDVVAEVKPKGFFVYRVRGNCDFAFPAEPVVGLAGFGGVLIFYTHGHMYGVKSGLYQLAEVADERMADIALYGHTHRQQVDFEELEGKPTLFNPGSLGFGGQYGVLECEEGEYRILECRVPAAERG